MLHLDFSGRAYNEMDVVAKTLDDALRKWEKEYGSENRSDIPGIRFGNVIEAAYRRSGRQVVILSMKRKASRNSPRPMAFRKMNADKNLPRCT